MGLIVFDETHADHLVAGDYSAGRGPVLRSELMELTRISFRAGEGAQAHRHPEEQLVYVLTGRLEVQLGQETYEVGPGQASFHPADVVHSSKAIEDTSALSFKVLVDPAYATTGELT